MFLRLACISLVFSIAAVSAVDWKSVWLEPRTPAVLLAVGETRPFTVIGRNGEDVKVDLTKTPGLKIASSDSNVLEIDAAAGTFIGKKTGHTDIHISVGEVSDMVPAFVRASPAAETAARTPASLDGVWRAVFTGDPGDRPKMVSEIVFALTSRDNALTGTVHAAYWPGDAAVSDGKVEGDRVTFSMTGHLPFHAGTSGAMVTGYPKLCFVGVHHAGEMKIDLYWTEARQECSEGRLLPMAGKKLAD